MINNNNNTVSAKAEPNKPLRSNTDSSELKEEQLDFNENEPLIPINQQIHYVFTLNNYTENEIQKLIIWLDEKCKRYCFQEEIGEEKKTPHLQGYFQYKKKDYYKSLHKYMDRRISIRVSKDKTRNKLKAIKYCTDINKRAPGGRCWNQGCPKWRQMTLITPSFGWESDILLMCGFEPDDRSIYWYWSKEGNVGKTQFTKYLCVKHKACLLSGKRDNIYNGIVKYEEVHGELPELVVYDIPRSVDNCFISYEALEKIKDMCFYSGKYEGAQVCGPSPHVIVFSNREPDRHKMSIDRWKIFNIDPNPKINRFTGRERFKGDALKQQQ